MTKTQRRKNTSATTEKHIIPMQLGLLLDAQNQTVQRRFELFGMEAADMLTAQRPDGEPVFPAGSAKAEFAVKVTIERLADDSLSFNIAHETKSKLPFVPGKARSAVFTSDNGLVQKATADQFPLFDPAHGQPVAKATDEVGDDDLDD